MNSDAARVQMVSQQVRTWDVLDPRVLDTMAAVDRQRFVPDAYQSVAFADSRIPLPEGQVMLTPKVVGRILQAAALRSSESVLEVGTGSGYLTACLAALAGTVTSIDIYESLTQHAAASLEACGITNANLATADAFEYTPRDRFDLIVVTGSLPVYIDRFAGWLKPNGRLFVVVGKSPVMEATLFSHIDDDNWQRDILFETDVPALVNAPENAPFEF